MSSSDDGMTVWLEDILINEDESLLGVIRTVASEGRPEASRSLSMLSKSYLFFFFLFIASQSREKFRCLPDNRPTGVGDGYHG